MESRDRKGDSSRDDGDDVIPALEVVEDASAAAPVDVSGFDGDFPSSLVNRVTCLQTLLSLVVKPVSFREFCRELMLLLVNSVPSEAASLLEVDPQKEFMFFRVAAGRCSDLVQNFQVSVGQGIAGKVYYSKKTLVINDAENSTEHFKSIEQAVGFRARNLLAVPILVRGDVFGVFELINRLGRGGYSSGDVEFAEYLSRWMSKAIEARLMIQYQKTNTERKAA